MERLLLHACCAPDATIVGRLVDEFSVAFSFYNPNIHPRPEFDRRREEMEKVLAHWRLPLIETPYDPDRWDEWTLALREGPERSERCKVCYAMRIEATARLAKERGFDRFGTVLSVSPHKQTDWILEAGNRAAQEIGIPFLSADLKQAGGYHETLDWCRTLGIWRQNYCGCRYSLWQREEEERIRQLHRARTEARLWQHLPAVWVRLCVMRDGFVLLRDTTLPAAPLFPGERLKDAVARLAQELGIRVSAVSPAGVEEALDRVKKEHRLIHDFVAVFSGPRETPPPEQAWCSEAELARRSVPPEVQRIIKKNIKNSV